MMRAKNQQSLSISLDELYTQGTEAYISALVDDIYPYLFSVLNRMGDVIEQLRLDADTEVIQSIHHKINSELDELSRKEKLVLFPFILKLKQENKKPETFGSFRNVDTQYSSILSLIKELRTHMQNIFKGKRLIAIDTLNLLVNELETDLILIQLSKEQKLFSPFKNSENI